MGHVCSVAASTCLSPTAYLHPPPPRCMAAPPAGSCAACPRQTPPHGFNVRTARSANASANFHG